MKEKKCKKYRVILVPEGNGKTYSLHVHRNMLIIFFISLAVFTAGVIFLIFKSGELGIKLHLVNSLQHENESLLKENRDLKMVGDNIKEIEHFAFYLHRLAKSRDDDFAYILDSIKGKEEGEKALQKTKRTSQKRRDSLLVSGVPSIMPLHGWVTKEFSRNPANPEKEHLAVDITAKEGTPVKASAKGIIKDLKYDKYLGLLVVIDHGNGFITRYGHCSQILVSEGDVVEAGQTVALLGNTGYSSAPHLHFEIIENGVEVDPFQYILTKY